MAVFKAKFGEIQLLKDHTLGIGSYGVVFKARCDNLICAAKVLHPTLFNPSLPHHVIAEKASIAPIRKFEQECEFLSTIRHPNVVQYLGLYEDPDTGLPVLLMELMDRNLTHFLHSEPEPNSLKPLSYCVQVKICHGVALALSFLHSNDIIHRDLSSNNILLTGDIRAKVTDFGMATLDNFASHLPLTKAPGSDVYMPPESWKDKPDYTATLDCFSFGVIIIQILTRLLPSPGDRLKEREISGDKVDVRVSEIERRQEHISKVDPSHPLLPVALDCLKDKGDNRPSAKQLCERIEVLKDGPVYSESISEESNETNQQEKEQVRDIQQNIESLQFEGIDRLIQQLEQALEQIREKDRVIKEVETQLGHANQKLTMIEQVQVQFKKQFNEYDRQVERLHSSQPVRLKWCEGMKAPIKVFRWSNAVMCENTIYVVFAGSKTILRYNTIMNDWSQLPNCPFGLCSISAVNDTVITIGGSEGNQYTNKLFSFVQTIHEQTFSGQWMENLPSMPTKRNQSISLCTGSALIVAGGCNEEGLMLRRVEVMNTETHQWSTAKGLLEAQLNASMTVCGSNVYMLGGLCSDDSLYTKSVFSIRLNALLELNSSDEDWKRIADLPYQSATAVSICGRLLAIGGRELNDINSSCIKAIQMYNPTTNSWEEISHMLVGRSRCCAVALTDNRLFVVGGWTGKGGGIDNQTDRVEIGTLL